MTQRVTRRSNDDPTATRAGPVDYSDQATQPAVLIDDDPEAGIATYQSPDGSSSVTIDYAAARRRPGRPPDYNLEEHYETPTHKRDVRAPYKGPESFAPSPLADEGAPETIPLSLSSFANMPDRPWEQPLPGEARRPTPDATYNVEISQPVRIITRRAEPTTKPRADRSQVAGGLRGNDEAPRSVIGISTPQAPSTPTPPPRHPAAPALAPRPTPPPIPPMAAQARPPRPPPPMRPPPFNGPPPPRAGRSPEAALRPAPMTSPPPQRRETLERSGVFIADEFEHAALRRSTLNIIIGFVFAGGMVLLFMALLLLALFGPQILAVIKSY